MKNLLSKIECCDSAVEHLLADFQSGVLTPGKPNIMRDPLRRAVATPTTPTGMS